MRVLATSLALMVPTPGFADEKADLLAKLLLENGCKLTSEMATTVMPANGFDRATAVQASRTLMAEGRATFASDGATLVLVDPKCPK